MLKFVFRNILSSLFLLIFSCSESQEQARNRAVYWLYNVYGYLSPRIRVDPDKLFSLALRKETGIKGREDVVERSLFYPVMDIGSMDFDDNCVKLLQCALMYKGYYNGPISGKFGPKTAAAVRLFKKDALGDNVATNSKVTPIFLLAIVEQGKFTLDREGSSTMRNIQQYLNRNYGKKCAIIPTHGKYSHRTHFNLIRALQIEVGCERIDKRFGDETVAACPTILPGTKGSLVYILQSALYANGINVCVNGMYDTSTVAAVKEFQKIMALPADGVAGVRTMKALLDSSGDVTRPALACDCFRQLSFDDAKLLYDQGFRYVGRYLTGNIKGFRGKAVSKHLTEQELQNITKAGLRTFLIFQDHNGHNVRAFSINQGIEDAQKALAALKKLGVQKGAVVYFSVDCDPFESQINKMIVPYFETINRIFRETGYVVGVYGSRMLCRIISEKRLARYSFVGDITSMHHGNIAQKMPSNWAFDQFFETKIKYSGGKFRLDKVAVSGKDHGIISNTLQNNINIKVKTKKIKRQI